MYHISKKESRMIDIAKAIFVVMVVVIHACGGSFEFSSETGMASMPGGLDWVKYICKEQLFRCAVPGYFLISSILLYRKDFSWKQNVWLKCKRLLVPYFIVITVWICIYTFAIKIGLYNLYFSSEENIDIWNLTRWLKAYLGTVKHPLVYPLWFLRDLFVLNVLAKVIRWCVDRIPALYLGAVTALYVAGIDRPVFFMSIEGLFFFSLGCCMVKYGISIERLGSMKKGWSIPACVFSIAGACFMKYLNQKLLYNLFHIGAIFMLMFLCFMVAGKLAERDNNGKVLDLLIRYNFGIYLFHEMSLTILRRMYGRLTPKTLIFQVLDFTLLPALIIAGCILVCCFLERKQMRVYSLLTGNGWKK